MHAKEVLTPEKPGLVASFALEPNAPCHRLPLAGGGSAPCAVEPCPREAGGLCQKRPFSRPEPPGRVAWGGHRLQAVSAAVVVIIRRFHSNLRQGLWGGGFLRVQ